MSLDLDAIVAIDVHTHAERSAHAPQDPVTGELLEAAAAYFGGQPPQPSTQEVADYYRERSMLAVVFTVDDEAAWVARISNDEVLEVAAAIRRADPFASIDPHKGKLGLREARRLIASTRRCAASSSTPARRPSAERRAHYPLYELIAAAGRCALPHRTDRDRRGHARWWRRAAEVLQPDGARRRRGRLPGAQDHPRHPSFPWQEEALAVATHKPNVYIDLSGWSPKYFPRS